MAGANVQSMVRAISAIVGYKLKNTVFLRNNDAPHS